MGNETRYHNVLFVETQVDGGGYENKSGRNPVLSQTYYAKAYFGLLQTVPPPHRQRAFNPKTMATEQIEADGSFYQANE
ncbi:hypothetical protein GQ44DRAFT_742924 [Phaeosphaeriaceae sp. PMI808]|nr:hypothetical protein GQ44DRAFT_742924 [Phaeosphaeriaceae sp. PMI808]